MRLLRLAIGGWMVVLAFQTRDWAPGLLGAFFLYQAATDTGCCGSQACYAPKSNQSRKADEKITEVEYEEIK